MPPPAHDELAGAGSSQDTQDTRQKRGAKPNPLSLSSCEFVLNAE